MSTILLTGAGGSASSNVAAALTAAGRGHRLIGADTSAEHLHLAPMEERWLLPRADDPSYVETLIALLEETSADVLHAQPDPEVLVIGAHRELLPAATYLPGQEVLELAADKLACASRLAAAGVGVPEAHVLDDAEAAATVAGMLQRHPRLWIRARRGAGARASLPVSSVDQALAWISWWVAEKGMQPSDFMASELLPGREFAWQSLWADGELVAAQARERVEYLYGHLAPSGQSSTPAVARTVRVPAIDELGEAAVRAIDPRPRGLYCIDIKEAADGSPRVTEINAGRFFTTANFFPAAGLNMPDMLIRLALGEHIEPVGASPLPADLYWIRMVDMGFQLVPGDELDRWPRPDR